MKKKLALGMALIVALLGVTVVLAAYTGPQRKTHLACGAPHNVFYVNNGLHRYMCSYKNTCGDQVDTPQALKCSTAICQDLKAGLPYLRVEDTCTRVPDPPATVSAQVQCNGGGGWCRDSAVVTIQGNEPVRGYTIVGIEGMLDGATFACNTAACNVPVSGGGSHHLTYWALSSYGDTSLMGQTDVRIDADMPTLTLHVPSPDGQDGWFVTPPTVQASAADATSGIASVQYQIDGGAWQSGTEVTLTAEGVHTVVFRATDVAGHQTTAGPVTVKVDTTAPTLTPALPTPDGQNGWFVTQPTVHANASDAASGIASVQYQIDGGAWQSGTEVRLTAEGRHTVTFRATDVAGHQTMAGPVTVRVDTTPPTLTASLPTPSGQNGWFVTAPVKVEATGNDAVSGLAAVQCRLDGGAWQAPPLAVSTDGAHTVTCQTVDVAGNTTTWSHSVALDTAAPTLAPTLPMPDGQNGWFVTPPTVHANASDAASGIASVQYQIDGGAWQSGTEVTLTAEGVHTVTFRATDVAGHQTMAGPVSVKVDTTPPTLTPALPTPDGQNGWFVTAPVKAEATAHDDVSGVASVQYQIDGGAWQSGTEVTLTAEGVHTVVFRATDVAGHQTTAGPVSVKVDTTPPTLTPALPTPDGQNGWFVTAPVKVEATGNDAVSGLAAVQCRLDGGAWQTPPLAVSTDGTHTVTCQAVDAAGNTTTWSHAVAVDTTPPVTRFTAPQEGAVISGVVTLQGAVDDPASGGAATWVSVDRGMTWTPANLLHGHWTLFWDTRALPDGVYTLLARSVDRAGNVEHTAVRHVTVDNAPPRVSLTPTRWMFWENGHAHITPNPYIPISKVKVVITDPKRPGWERTWVYGGKTREITIHWNTRWYSENGPYAHPGEYTVRVRAWDIYGREAVAAGTIVVPPQAAAAPTATRTPLAGAPTPSGAAWFSSPTPTGTLPAPTATLAGALAGNGNGGAPPQAPAPAAGGVGGPALRYLPLPSQPVSNKPSTRFPWGAAALALAGGSLYYAARRRKAKADLAQSAAPQGASPSPDPTPVPPSHRTPTPTPTPTPTAESPSPPTGTPMPPQGTPVPSASSATFPSHAAPFSSASEDQGMREAREKLIDGMKDLFFAGELQRLARARAAVPSLAREVAPTWENLSARLGALDIARDHAIEEMLERPPESVPWYRLPVRQAKMALATSWDELRIRRRYAALAWNEFADTWRQNDGLKGWLDWRTRGIRQRVGEIGEEAGGRVKGLVEAVGERLPTREDVAAAFEETRAAAGEAWESGVKAVKGFTGRVKGLAKAVGERLPTREDVAATFGEARAAAGEALESGVKAVKGFAGRVKGLAEVVGDHLPTREGLMAPFENAREAARGVWKQGVEAMSEHLPTREGLVAALESARDAGSRAWENSVEAVKNFPVRVKGLAEAVGERLPTREGLMAALESARDAGSRAWENSVEAVKNFPVRVKGLAEAVGERLPTREDVAATFGEARAAAGEALESGVNAVKGFAGRVKGLAEAVGERLPTREDLAAAFQSAKDAVGARMSSWGERLGEFKGALAETGETLREALKSPFDKMGRAVEEAGGWRAVASDALDGALTRGGQIAERLADGAGVLGLMAGVVGGSGYLLTRRTSYRRLMDSSEVLGGIQGAADVVRYGGEFLESVSTAAENLGRLGQVGLFAKVAGPLAVLGGGIQLFSGIQELRTAGQSRSEQAVGVLHAASGFLNMAGGVLVLIPGGQAASAVLFGASAVLSAAGFAVEHWSEITDAVHHPVRTLREFGDALGQVGRDVGHALSQGARWVARGASAAAHRAGQAAARLLHTAASQPVVQHAWHAAQQAAHAVTHPVETAHRAARWLRHQAGRLWHTAVSQPVVQRALHAAQQATHAVTHPVETAHRAVRWLRHQAGRLWHTAVSKPVVQHAFRAAQGAAHAVAHPVETAHQVVQAARTTASRLWHATISHPVVQHALHAAQQATHAVTHPVETAHHVVQSVRATASRVAHTVFSWFGGGG